MKIIYKGILKLNRCRAFIDNINSFFLIMYAEFVNGIIEFFVSYLAYRFSNIRTYLIFLYLYGIIMSALFL
jgi:hypothetical protein